MIAQIPAALPSCSQALPQQFPKTGQPGAHRPIVARIGPAPGLPRNGPIWRPANCQHPQVIPATSPILAFLKGCSARPSAISHNEVKRYAKKVASIGKG